jgi:hypothetical protein
MFQTHKQHNGEMIQKNILDFKKYSYICET